MPAVKSGGGTECLLCTVVASVVERLAMIHNKSVAEAMDYLCDVLVRCMFCVYVHVLSFAIA